MMIIVLEETDMSDLADANALLEYDESLKDTIEYLDGFKKGLIQVSEEAPCDACACDCCQPPKGDRLDPLISDIHLLLNDIFLDWDIDPETNRLILKPE